MLAERSLPGCLIVDHNGRRFANESADYMSFGQRLLELERSGSPVEAMWIIFDQQYRNSYVFGATLFPRMKIPPAWYDEGIAKRADSLADVGRRQHPRPGAGIHPDDDPFQRKCFCRGGSRFGRGRSAYDRYYGDPTITPSPNLRPLLKGPFYAVRMVLERPGYLRRAQGRRTGAGTARGRQRHRRLVRNWQYRGQRVRRNVPGRGGDDRTRPGIRLHRGPGCGWRRRGDRERGGAGRSGSPPSD